MTTYHTTSISIIYGANSEAFFAYNQPTTLIIFVHGFGGNAIGTWNNFSSMLLLDESSKFSDLVFYGYDTLYGQAGDHAAQFYHFLLKIVHPLRNTILPSGQKLPERNYEKIVVVAHSLGSIVVRQALLLAYIDNTAWLNKTVMALFAPAHQGANILPLAMEALPGLWGLVGLLARYKYPILNDLNPKDSLIIGQIKEQTKQLQDQGIGDFTKAKLVVFAKGDKVVANVPYLMDKPAEVIEGFNHVQICKPNSEYDKPLELLKQLL